MTYWTLEINDEFAKRWGAFVWDRESGQLVSMRDCGNPYRFYSLPDVEIERDQFNDYWAMKGRPLRCHVVKHGEGPAQ